MSKRDALKQQEILAMIRRHEKILPRQRETRDPKRKPSGKTPWRARRGVVN